ncbi:MAG: fatty acid desaturase [Sterolibacteriaceae bacterium]|uniref:Fatty acid desaturase n=1 Tax=Candidatus Methylophosphatis roskildensis TaxID=2899263 RepID=A0A9D7E4V5_9PROT|nr:fatty acid desaturase [Candidatus Methylophosphatis roskildensis]
MDAARDGTRPGTTLDDRVHELFHLRSEREVDTVTRLLPFSFTLMSVGYRELLVNHRSHHRHMATPLDAEYFQLRGSPLAGLLNAFSAPEQLWFRWIAEHGMDGALLRGTLIRLALILALIAAAGTSFLWYWVPARVAFGLSYLIFFYCLHRRGKAFGVYPLVLPRALARIARLLWGRDVVEATLHHDVHHAQPRIAARHLAEARPTVRESRQVAANRLPTG